MGVLLRVSYFSPSWRRELQRKPHGVNYAVVRISFLAPAGTSSSLVVLVEAFSVSKSYPPVLYL